MTNLQTLHARLESAAYKVSDNFCYSCYKVVDCEDLFEEILDECYPEVTVGCCTFSPSAVMKELDPTCFRIGAQENLDSLAEDDQLYECNGEYYNMHEIEEMIDEIEAD